MENLSEILAEAYPELGGDVVVASSSSSSSSSYPNPALVAFADPALSLRSRSAATDLGRRDASEARACAELARTARTRALSPKSDAASLRAPDAVRFMEMKSARLPNLAASLAFSASLTHFLHRGLASRHSQSPKKRRRPHSEHDAHRLLSLSLVYTLTTGSTVPSPPSSASSTRFVHAPAARSLRCARVGAVPTSDIATRCGPEGGQHEGGRAGWFPAGSITRVNSRIARDRRGGRFGPGSGDASRAKRVARVADHAPPRGGGR